MPRCDLIIPHFLYNLRALRSRRQQCPVDTPYSLGTATCMSLCLLPWLLQAGDCSTEWSMDPVGMLPNIRLAKDEARSEIGNGDLWRSVLCLSFDLMSRRAHNGISTSYLMSRKPAPGSPSPHHEGAKLGVRQAPRARRLCHQAFSELTEEGRLVHD